jgi:hypothetical protein
MNTPNTNESKNFQKLQTIQIWMAGLLPFFTVGHPNSKLDSKHFYHQGIQKNLEVQLWKWTANITKTHNFRETSLDLDKKSPSRSKNIND